MNSTGLCVFQKCRSYSPNLALSDYYHFPKMKTELSHLDCDNNILAAVDHCWSKMVLWQQFHCFRCKHQYYYVSQRSKSRKTIKLIWPLVAELPVLKSLWQLLATPKDTVIRHWAQSMKAVLSCGVVLCYIQSVILEEFFSLYFHSWVIFFLMTIMNTYELWISVIILHVSTGIWDQIIINILST